MGRPARRARRRGRPASPPTPCSCSSTRRSSPPASAPTRTSARPTRAAPPVIDVDRGGKITFHGPGQLVGYPIVTLPDHVKVVDYVRRVEEALIAVCAELGVTTARVPGRSGVWLRADDRGPERKIAALGIRVSRGVTMHGFALNCDVDLGWYDRFVPCGIADAGVTSLSQELGRDVTVAEVIPSVERHLDDLPRVGAVHPDAGLRAATRARPRAAHRTRHPVGQDPSRGGPCHRDVGPAQGVPHPTRRPARGRPEPRPRGPGRRRPRLPRAQRLGQDHDDPDAAGPGPRDPGLDGALRADGPAPPARRHRPRRRGGRVAQVLPQLHRPSEPAAARPHPGHRHRPHRARPRHRQPRRAGPRPLQVLLPRHEAAAGDRGHPAQGPRAADPRRADQRPRPGRHPRDPRDHPRRSASPA